MERLLKLLANPTSQAILHILRAEPTYARKIAALLDMKESEVTRRLRQLEEAGLVSSAWSYIGKNVKMYQMEAEGISVRFGAQGMSIEMTGPENHEAKVVDRLAPRIPANEDFVGREEELAALQDGHSVHIVIGMAGIGKTSLLAHVARGADQPVFWHTFRGVESLRWLANRLGVFADHHGDSRLLRGVESDAATGDLRLLILETLDHTGFLFCFDDLHRIEDQIVEDLLCDAIAGTTNGRLILASRERPRGGEGARHVREIQVGGLTQADAAALLERDGVADAARFAHRLHPLLGGHPLALHLLSRASAEDMESILERVPSGHAELHDYLLGEVDARLTDPERRVLTTASVFRGGFDLAGLRAVAQKTIHEKDVLALQRSCLLRARGDGYLLHDIVRSFFYQMLDDARPLHAAAAQHFAQSGSAEDRIEAMHHGLAAGRRDDVLQLIEENLDLRDFDFIDAGYANLYEHMLGMFDRDQVRSDRHWGIIQDELGDIALHRGDHAAALARYTAAGGLLGEDDERIDLAWKRAMCLYELGRGDEACQWIDQGLALAADGRSKERLERLRDELLAA